ncbi:procathepsin L isoform X2 [Cuculus canorus]|uniref:procathepsin L isoform X2 n=1 Tax=Cuculus canorus TaxID=55661 RepID=UPI0023AA707C|nr:procathepsin L isoform X2 [Cuculus canorus]
MLDAMVMLLGLLLALLGFAPAPDPALEEAWEEWKSFYAKEYPREAEATRREVWEKNLRRIQQHNWEQSQGQHAFRLAMNHYGDLTDEEFNQLLNRFIPAEREGLVQLFQASAARKTPAEVDWRAKGYVTPVKNQDTSSCRYNPQDRAANCSTIWMVDQGSEAALEQAVAAVGPVSVAVDASSFQFHFYKSGIFSSVFCSQWVNHGMLAVGYGMSQEHGHNVSYWILKNSWSEVWGEQGYIRLLKDGGNQCRVASQASFPML